MAKNVRFTMPQTVGVTTRTLTITPLPMAGDTLPVAPVSTTVVSGSAVVTLDDNRLYHARIVDEVTGGATTSPVDIIFHTRDDMSFPGYRNNDFYICAVEEESSDSSSSPSSASSLSSSSSTSSSSSSSSGTSSASSASSSSWSSHSSSSSSSSPSSPSSISTSSSSSSHSSSSWSS